MVVIEDEIRKRARVLLDLGRPAEALQEIRRALASNPNDPDSLEIEGLCHLRTGAHAEALRALAAAIVGAPGGAHAHYLYGFTLREAGRSSEAEGPFTAALRLAPDEPVYLRALAELFADLGRHDEALGLARRATEAGPERAANHVTYGYVASAAGKKDLARASYEQAVKLDPSDAAAWNNLGCLDLEAGRVLTARARFREALRLDPRGERAQRNLKLVLPARRPTSRTWEGTLEAVVAELVRAGVPRLTILAVVLEVPAAGQALVRGGGRGAALSGAVTVLALRAMGPAALVPLTFGAAVAGAAWLVTRNTLPVERQRVQRHLGEARARYDRLWGEWLAGTLLREARDQSIDLLVEELAFALAERGA
jgi:Flp pilus assembly protein TadD